jgi:hypothetical protein
MTNHQLFRRMEGNIDILIRNLEIFATGYTKVHQIKIKQTGGIKNEINTLSLLNSCNRGAPRFMHWTNFNTPLLLQNTKHKGNGLIFQWLGIKICFKSCFNVGRGVACGLSRRPSDCYGSNLVIFLASSVGFDFIHSSTLHSGCFVQHPSYFLYFVHRSFWTYLDHI